MKKAKVMLMVIAIFGLVGGALAFKAQKFGGGATYYTCNTADNRCDRTSKPGYTTMIIQGVPTLTVPFATTASGITCINNPHTCQANTLTLYSIL